MGANQSAGAEAPPEVLMQSDKKDSLNFVVPTEFVELPSKGKYYPENHPLYMQESIEIRYMTAKDEDILTSKTLLKQGVALNRFISNIIVDRRINSLCLSEIKMLSSWLQEYLATVPAMRPEYHVLLAYQVWNSNLI